MLWHVWVPPLAWKCCTILRDISLLSAFVRSATDLVNAHWPWLLSLSVLWQQLCMSCRDTISSSHEYTKPFILEALLILHACTIVAKAAKLHSSYILLGSWLQVLIRSENCKVVSLHMTKVKWIAASASVSDGPPSTQGSLAWRQGSQPTVASQLAVLSVSPPGGYAACKSDASWCTITGCPQNAEQQHGICQDEWCISTTVPASTGRHSPKTKRRSGECFDK